MNGRAFYNEIDPFAAAWLRELIAAGSLPAGDVDERDIRDIVPSDLDGYTQCHFFAGIGGWAYALRLAGWEDSRECWTGSCPCQPFSAAGRSSGFADERHLWPSFFHLIDACRPPVVMGEQVASKDGLAWLDLVHDDLEGAGYAVRAVDCCAAGIGAPHVRQRLWFVADAEDRWGQRNCRAVAGASGSDGSAAWVSRSTFSAVGCCRADGDGMANAQGDRRRADIGAIRGRSFEGLRNSKGEDERRPVEQNGNSRDCCSDGVLADSLSPRLEGRDAGALGNERETAERAGAGNPWIDVEWLPCRDGKARPTQPGLQPLLDGLPVQLERLRALEYQAWQRLIDYGAAHKNDTHKVLRMVRDQLRTEEIWTSLRRSSGIRATEVLFDFLQCVEATCGRGEINDSLAKTRTEARRRIVRGLRSDRTVVRSSCERQSDGQHPVESSDALLALSQLSACDAEAYRQIARSAHAASNRVGMLRGAGNAIIPQVAAEVIRAVMEVE